ncbi:MULTISPECIES: transglutaminase-like domain-containing protein [Maribacter]|uniref:Transglutaminase family protein n=1 Tax=Maribacter flavus TaxID=1658664 RepID=A0ABU7IFZ7_9FLAO|nr:MULTISPECIES: transglutaminase family protein [Maribacter]MDC6405317.1 transglutaminase family protein [Maribacter sp. PR66]MEE1971874.1 transglutaminase family protein [Maribacter flavus]
MTYLNSSYFFDYNDTTIDVLLKKSLTNDLSSKEKAIRLYTLVRDGWKYDPYSINLSKENYRSSTIVQKSTGNCVEKSILLISLLRGAGIPARLHLGKVKNHIAVERLTEKFGSNELTPHGMVNALLDDKWLKMSPAFNKSLCEKFNVEPLEFDGNNSSYLQQYNNSGSLFMEYTDDYGYFEDVPLDFMKKNIEEHYPHIFKTKKGKTEFKL